MNETLIAGLAVTFLLPCQDPPPKPRTPEPGCTISVPLVAERGDPVEAKRFGLVLGSDRAGLRRFEVLDVQDGKLAWDVPARACDGTRLTWYLVRGLSDKERVEEFWKNPAKWFWVRVDAEPKPGDVVQVKVEWGTAAYPLIGQGTIREAGGGIPRVPLLSVQTQFNPGGPITPASIDLLYDPWAGRFWVRPKLTYEGLTVHRWLCTVTRSGAFPKDPGSCTREAVELARAEESPILLHQAAGLRVRLSAAADQLPLRCGVRLVSQEGNVTVQGVVGRDEVGDWLWFERVPRGCYTLESMVRTEKVQHVVKEGILLDEGRVESIEDAIPVDRLVIQVKIRVLSPDGTPARSGRITVVRSHGQDGTECDIHGLEPDGNGTSTFDVLPEGGRFVVIVPGHEAVVLDDLAKDAEIRLKPWSKGAGALDVRLDGLPSKDGILEDLWVLLEPADGIPSWAAAVTSRSLDLRRAPVDREGHARFEDLPKGRFYVRLGYGVGKRAVPVYVTDPRFVEVDGGSEEATLSVPGPKLEQAQARWKRFRGLGEARTATRTRPADPGKDR